MTQPKQTLFKLAIDGLKRKKTDLEQENAELRRAINSTKKSMEDAPWNEQTESRNEIREYENDIEENNKKIKDLENQIQEMIKTNNLGKDR